MAGTDKCIGLLGGWYGSHPFLINTVLKITIFQNSN
jgi:hypothetical protein